MSTLDMSNEPVPVEEVASTSAEEPNITTNVEDVPDEEEESVVSSDEEVAEPEPVVQEVAEPDVADVAEEPAPEEPAPEEPVQEEVKSSNNDLEDRVKVLEERLEKLIDILKILHPSKAHFGTY
jgi:hypothetical protein